MSKLTHERLLEVLKYDEESGSFTWLKSTSNRVKVGQIAGNSSGHEYDRIRIDGELYYAHRLAYFYMTSMWPDNKVDHKDISKRNNMWSNLRAASNQSNSANAPMHKNNTVGLKGVSRDGSRFRAQIMVNRKYVHLGSFGTPEEAHAAYVKAANENFGLYARAA